MTAWRANSRYFSLVELMVVISIILVLSGLAAGRLGQMPTAASLERTERELELLFAQAAQQAALQGRPVVISYRAETREFALEAAGTDRDANMAFLRQRFQQVSLLPEMEIEFPGREPDAEISYRSWPDGTASGPDLLLKQNDRRIRLKISPLTGQLLRQEQRRRR